MFSDAYNNAFNIYYLTTFIIMFSLRKKKIYKIKAIQCKYTKFVI